MGTALNLCTRCGRETAGKAQCACGNGEFTNPENVVGTSLIASLAPVVDSMRDIETCLGARAYKVSLIWTRWSEGSRGFGQELLVAEYPILPTPQVEDLGAMSKELGGIGIEEVGTLRVSEISPRLHEDLLVGRDVVVPRGQPIPEDMNFYWEVTFVSKDKKEHRRRFVPKNVPNKFPTRFEWVITLLRASGGRTPMGELAG